MKRRSKLSKQALHELQAIQQHYVRDQHFSGFVPVAQSALGPTVPDFWGQGSLTSVRCLSLCGLTANGGQGPAWCTPGVPMSPDAKCLGVFAWDLAPTCPHRRKEVRSYGDDLHHLWIISDGEQWAFGEAFYDWKVSIFDGCGLLSHDPDNVLLLTVNDQQLIQQGLRDYMTGMM